MKKLNLILIVFFTFGLTLQSCSQDGKKLTKNKQTKDLMENNNDNMEKAVFGAGCFWCVEAIFQNLKGVEKVVSGYAGGHVPNPDYRNVVTGSTGHAEVIEVTYDPAEITYKDLLEVFFQTHDPTSLNRQGADIGTQYRSAIFYIGEEQKELAEFYKKQLDNSGAYQDPIVTEITPLDVFYKAEGYHQDYYNSNPNQPYCSFVIKPKLDKFNKVFKDKLK